MMTSLGLLSGLLKRFDSVELDWSHHNNLTLYLTESSANYTVCGRDLVSS